MANDVPQREGFWAALRRLRVEGKIGKQWKRSDIRPHLSAAGYSENAIRSIPSNGSMSRDGSVRGNYVRSGGMPQAYRLSDGVYELIDDAGLRHPEVTALAPGTAPHIDIDFSSARERLAVAVEAVLPSKRLVIEALKNTGPWEREDFLWEALLLSMATMGNSRGAVLVAKPEHHSKVRWGALSHLAATERQLVLLQTLTAAGVRMSSKKARWLAENYDRIVAGGGPAALKAHLQSLPGRDAKVAFLRTFRGVGHKYARNMLMDVYHADFRDSIAIDLRIQKISKALGVRFRTYTEGEQFYLTVAHAVGLNGWEFDRLLYRFTDDVIAAVPAVSFRSIRR